MTCRTCSHAVITHVAECALKDNDGSPVHPDGCPREFTCAHWQQGDEHDLWANGIDWSNSTVIEID